MRARIAVFAGVIGLALVGGTTVGLAPAAAEEKQTDVRGEVVRLIARSHALLVKAFHAVKRGGNEVEKYRGAWMRQHAAGRALAQGKLSLAAKLSLQSRKLARKIIEANEVPLAADEAEDLPAEKRIAEPVVDAPDEEFDATMDAVEKETPAVEKLLEEEPKPPPAGK